MSKFGLLSIPALLFLLSGCGPDSESIDESSFSDSSSSMSNDEQSIEQPESLNLNYSSIDDKTPAGEHIIKVLYAQGLKRVYLLKNGVKETRTGGTRAWRNNNEGNLEYGKFARSHFAVGKDPRFAIFPSEHLGLKAKEQLIFGAKSYRNKTLFAAIHRYAPSVENNTTWYYRTVKVAAGSEKLMHQYGTEERKRIILAMRKVEGWRKGKVYREQPQSQSECYRRNIC